MRWFLCLLLLGVPLLAQTVTRDALDGNGTFFVNGVVYRFAAGADCTVVAAAHAVINRKFVAVKVRVYNRGARSISVRPEDIRVEDAIGSRELAPVAASELARKMRRPQNMARYAVNGIGGAPTDQPITSDMVNATMLEMMKSMTARANNGGTSLDTSVLYTDSPGALDEGDLAAGPAACDDICRLRAREAQGADPLSQLQHPSTPEAVEQYALLANTIPPRGNVGGVLYYPLGKVAETAAAHGKKTRRLRVTVPVQGENFQFELPVE